MIRRRAVGALLAVSMAGGAAGPADAAPDPSGALAPIIHAAATWAGVAPELLAAIVWVESHGDPWALNIRGQARHPRTHAEAVALVRAVRGEADIGLAQIHASIWGPVFGLPPDAFLDPWINLHAAAAILRLVLAQEPESWGGVGRYHSGTPWRRWVYARRVAAAVRARRLPIEQGEPAP